jgi:hypothetical protein
MRYCAHARVVTRSSSMGPNHPRRLSHAPDPAPSQGEGRASGGRHTSFRSHARKPVLMHSLVRHVQVGWQHHAAVENIGLGGARIRIDAAIVAGDTVTLSFAAPSLWAPLVLRSRVVWVSSAGRSRAAGVAFEHTTTDAAFALYELIAALGSE